MAFNNESRLGAPQMFRCGSPIRPVEQTTFGIMPGARENAIRGRPASSKLRNSSREVRRNLIIAFSCVLSVLELGKKKRSYGLSLRPALSPESIAPAVEVISARSLGRYQERSIAGKNR